MRLIVIVIAHCLAIFLSSTCTAHAQIYDEDNHHIQLRGVKISTREEDQDRKLQLNTMSRSHQDIGEDQEREQRELDLFEPPGRPSGETSCNRPVEKDGKKTCEGTCQKAHYRSVGTVRRKRCFFFKIKADHSGCEFRYENEDENVYEWGLFNGTCVLKDNRFLPDTCECDAVPKWNSTVSSSFPEDVEEEPECPPCPITITSPPGGTDSEPVSSNDHLETVESGLIESGPIWEMP